jgi:hypothetical protein
MTEYFIISGDTLELKNNRTIILKKVLVANTIKYSVRKDLTELEDDALVTKLHLAQSVFTFQQLVAALQQGNNISFDIDEEAKTITINSLGGGGGLAGKLYLFNNIGRTI